MTKTKKFQIILGVLILSSVFFIGGILFQRYLGNDKGKILPRRMTGACAKHQRHIAQQVKYARFMALIPYVK